MNDLEIRVKEEFERQGYEVLRNGWPDFLIVKRDGTGKVVDAKAVEVKREKQGLKEHQQNMMWALSDLGIKTWVANEGIGWGETLPGNFHLSVSKRNLYEED